MQLVHKLSLALLIFALAVAVGCGGGGNVVLPPPTGTYSVASLSGSYVYQVHGFSLILGVPYQEVGVFTTDAAGHITGGSDDFAAGGVISHAITGTYQVASDGTGFLTINPTALGQITFAITLASSSKVYLMEADNFADGAGVAELQTGLATPTGTYVYRVHQVALNVQNPVAEVGAINFAGGVITGSADQNLGGTSSQLTLNGTLGAAAALGRGTGTLTDNTNFTTNFIYYVVSPGKLVFLVT